MQRVSDLNDEDEKVKDIQSENGGDVGMMEVIQSVFALLESETKASEASAQNEHDATLS